MTLAAGVDVLLVLVLVTFCIRGGIRGFSGEAISLIATIGGFLIAWKLSPEVARVITSFVPLDQTACRIGSLVAIYVLVLILGAYAGRAIKAFLKFTNLSGIDRGMGIVAGAVKAFALLLIIYVGVMYFSPVMSAHWMDDSVTMRMAHRAWPMVQKSLSGISLLDPKSIPWTSGEDPGSDSERDGRGTN